MSESSTIDLQIAGIQKGLSTFIEKNDRKTAELAARTLLLEQHITSPVPVARARVSGCSTRASGSKSSRSDGFAALRKGAKHRSD